MSILSHMCAASLSAKNPRLGLYMRFELLMLFAGLLVAFGKKTSWSLKSGSVMHKRHQGYSCHTAPAGQRRAGGGMGEAEGAACGARLSRTLAALSTHDGYSRARCP